MKLAYIVPSLAQRGPVLVVFHLVQEMLAHGHECTVYYFDNIIELKFPCKTERIFFLKSINFSSYDIVHSHGLRPDAYIFLHKPWRLKGTVCISTLHNMVIQDLAAQYNVLTAYLIGNMWMFLLCRHTKVVVLTKVALNYYSRWISQKKLFIVHNTCIIDKCNKLYTAEVKRILSFKENKILLGCNALLTPRKGVDQIIRVLPFMPNVKLWIVGDGKSKISLLDLADRLGVRDRVCIAGCKKNAYQYLPYYDIYVMSSRSEGFPLSLLEAMIYKRNIVCSDIPIFKEILSENEVTFFEREKIDSLMEAIKLALQTDKSEVACQCFWEHYSPDCFYRDYLAVYTN